MFEVQFMIGDLVTGQEKLTAKTLAGAKRQVNNITWNGNYNGNTACIYCRKELLAHGVVKRNGRNDARVKNWTDLTI